MTVSQVYTKEGLLEVIEALPLAIALIDRNRRVALVNRKALLFVSKQESQLIGYVGGAAFECIHHDDVPEGCGFGPDCLKCRLRLAVIDTMEKKHTLYGVETVMEFKGIGKRHLRISTSPLVLKNEGMVLLSIEDVTETKILEQTRLEKEKLAAVLKTAGAVCHELNQPLMIIRGFSDLLLEDLPDDYGLRQNIFEIKEQIDRMGKITKKLMSITRLKTKSYLNSEIIDIYEASVETPELNQEKES